MLLGRRDLCPCVPLYPLITFQLFIILCVKIVSLHAAHSPCHHFPCSDSRNLGLSCSLSQFPFFFSLKLNGCNNKELSTIIFTLICSTAGDIKICVFLFSRVMVGLWTLAGGRRQARYMRLALDFLKIKIGGRRICYNFNTKFKSTVEPR
jgi:hypothetical protein